MGHGRIKCRATDCDCNGSHVAERGRLRAAPKVLQQLTRPQGLPKYAEVAPDIIVCGLDCGWKNSMNSAAIHILIFLKFVHPKDADSSDERGRSRVPGETGGSSPVARNGPSST